MSEVPLDLIKKIRRIEITTARKAQDIFAGEYQSTFKGKGMDFDEVREYQEGDDVRHIDWNVTARMDSPHLKVFKEERELTVNIMVDISSSGDIGSAGKSKREVAAEIAAVIAFSAIRNNDRVGLILFSDHVEKHVRPGKGSRHVLRVIRDILFHEPQGKGTKTVEALRYLNQVTPRASIVFLISDFIDQGTQRSLKITNSKHDLIAIHIMDPLEAKIPNIGRIRLEDIETGKLVMFDSRKSTVRKKYERSYAKHMEDLREFFRRMGIDMIEISTARPYERDLEQFFKTRNDRKRRG
ncbi:DUF58 domain-containing protein [Kiritimatiellaeota bacterium B1221]|nr:DUF58 domain-containing protein [Kiritimatiellaeota bacterium B1221]